MCVGKFGCVCACEIKIVRKKDACAINQDQKGTGARSGWWCVGRVHMKHSNVFVCVRAQKEYVIVKL